MKIAFDISPLKSEHKNRGIGAYTYNLLSHLKQISNIEIQEFENVSDVKEVDAVHIPYFDLFKHSLPVRKKFPFIVTIHDVTPLVLVDYYPKGLIGSVNYQLQKLALKNVSAVITDSNSSKKDINQYLKVSLEKISAIHLAPAPEFKKINDAQFLKSIKNKYSLPSEFALYTGNVNGNKNLLNMAQACKKANIQLVIVGSGFDQRQNLDHPELLSLKSFLKLYSSDIGIKMLGYVDTNELVGIMNLASVLMLVSLYEGFGLPILEAQSCGCAVIASNISSMPEIAGDGAILVNPNSVEDIIKGLEKIRLKDERIRLVKNGLENVKSFSWEKTVRETLEVYQRVIKL